MSTRRGCIGGPLSWLTANLAEFGLADCGVPDFEVPDLGVTSCSGRTGGRLYERRPARLQPLASISGRAGSTYERYFLLRRCTRVRFSNLRCFFFAMRLRRFLMTEPTKSPHIRKVGSTQRIGR